MPSGSEIASLYVTVGADTGGFERGMQRVRGGVSGGIGALGGLATAAAGALGGAAVIHSALQFDRSMANIRAVTGKTAQEAAALGQELLRIGSESIAGPQAVADAYYDIVGGVADASTHMAILDAAIATAEAGQADLAATTGGLISIMNAYSLGADKAMYASDVFTRTVGVGVGTMDEFVDAMSPIAGSMAVAGVEFEDLGAMMAFMTTKGVRARMAATQLRQATVALLNPNERMRQSLQRMGFASGTALLQQYGLAGAMIKLNQEVGGSADEMAKMMGSVEALNAAMILAGPGMTEFAEDFELGMAGATDAARQLQLDTVSAQFDQFKSRLEGVAISIGQIFLPALNDILGGLNKVLGGVAQFIGDVQTMGLGPAIEKWWNAGVEWLETEGRRLFEQAVSSAINFVSDAVTWVQANAPAIAAAVVEWFDGALRWLSTDGKMLFESAVWAAINFVGNAVEWVKANAPNIAQGVIDFFRSGLEWFVNEGPTFVSDTLGTVINAIGNLFGVPNLTAVLGDIGKNLETIIGAGLAAAGNALRTFGDGIGRTLRTLGTGATNAFHALFGEGPGTVGGIVEEGIARIGGLLRGADFAGAFDSVINGVRTAWDSLFSETGFMRTAFESAWNGVVTFLENSGFVSTFEGIVNAVLLDIEALVQGFNNIVDGIRKMLGIVDAEVAETKSGMQELIKMINSPTLTNLPGTTTTSETAGINVNSPEGNWMWELPPDPRENNAFGGPVFAGRPTWVGERGPEVFIPPTGGRIIPNSALGGGGGGEIVIHNVMNLDSKVVYESIVREDRRRNSRWG